MIDFVTFGIIIDDVVLPDGRVAGGLLGGGGPQTAFGLRLWSERVGLVARVGADLPETARAWLREAGIDTRGVRETALPTLRAWQRLDAAGRRQHQWQVPPEVIAGQLERSVGDVPEAYGRVRGWHLGLHPDEPDLGLLAGLRARGGSVSVEPFRPAQRPLSPAALRALLGATDVFSPNAAGAASLVGLGPALDLARNLVAAGAGVVALRLGEEGSLAVEGGSRRAVRIPVVPVKVADPVGAGNAYCGGFLAGWVETRDLAEAGARGAVAASFVVEQIGLPKLTDSLRARALERLGALRPRVTEVGWEA